MIRFILERALDNVRRDVVTLAVILLALACWPFDLILDLLGVP